MVVDMARFAEQLQATGGMRQTTDPCRSFLRHPTKRACEEIPVRGRSLPWVMKVILGWPQRARPGIDEYRPTIVFARVHGVRARRLRPRPGTTKRLSFVRKPEGGVQNATRPVSTTLDARFRRHGGARVHSVGSFR